VTDCAITSFTSVRVTELSKVAIITWFDETWHRSLQPKRKALRVHLESKSPIFTPFLPQIGTSDIFTNLIVTVTEKIGYS